MAFLTGTMMILAGEYVNASAFWNAMQVPRSLSR